MPGDQQDTLDPRGGGAGLGPGRTVGGRYRLEAVLGRGGMGVVWAGRDQLLDRPVAVKEVIPPTTVDDADREAVRERTLREARAAARISADGVVAIYDVVEHDGRPWIVMERLPPRTLEDELAERGGLPPREVAEIGLSVLAGLSAAHAAGVLHRDVKPSNVMFRERPDGRRAVLADFGIAHFDGDAILTATGAMMGSPAYIAPERARGEAATPASDLWSLGVTLWAAVEGWSPFRRVNSLASLTAVITEDVPRAARAGPLQPVLEGLLRKQPAERIDAATARRLLARVLAPSGSPGEPQALGATRALPVLPPRAPLASAATSPTAATATPPPPAAPARPSVLPASVPPRTPSRAVPVTTAPAAALPGGASPATPVTATDDSPPWWSPRPDTGDERPAPRRGVRPAPALAVVLVLALAGVGAAVLRPWEEAQPTASTSPAPAAAPTPAPQASEPAAGAAGEGRGAATDGGTDPSAADPQGGVAEPDPAADGAADGAADAADPSADGGSDPAAGPDAAPAAPADPAAPAPVPSGFELHSDPTGFSVAVPAGWRVSREGPRVYLRDPASSAYLLVDQTDQPAPDPVADWRRQEPAVAGRLENYARIGEIRAVDFRGWQAADWEFVFGPGQGTHVLNRNLVTAPDQAYALYWSVPSSRWEAMLPVHEQVVSTFQPAP